VPNAKDACGGVLFSVAAVRPRTPLSTTLADPNGIAIQINQSGIRISARLKKVVAIGFILSRFALVYGRSGIRGASLFIGFVL
jgi:hypothetical protein